MKKKFALAVACAAGALCAEEIAVSEITTLIAGTNKVVLKVGTADNTGGGLPQFDGLAPIFHFDCMRTNGWTIAEGTMEVSKIPSLSGSRYLSLGNEGGTLDGNNLAGWTWATRLPPLLAKGTGKLEGKPVLDFGATGSKRALVFDPDEANMNSLDNIGTVIAVYDSSQGGGWFMGGGWGYITDGDNPHLNTGFLWHRGLSRTEAVGTDLHPVFSDPVFRHPAHHGLVFGMLWQDGWRTFPDTVGYSGGWQVLATEPMTRAGMPSIKASGIGLNDARGGMPERSGGQKIAEMIIYPGILDAAQRRAVEAHLQRKWFGTAPRGQAGNARIGLAVASENTTINAVENKGVVWTADVPANETLTIEKFNGGRQGGAAILKRGAGALRLGDTRNYTGAIRLAEGTLEYECRPVPATPPARMKVWLDASNTESLECEETNGKKSLLRWRNLAGDEAILYGSRISACLPYSDAARPGIVENAFPGENMRAIDFGAYGSGSALLFETNGVGGAKLDGVVCIVAVVGAQNGGGTIAGNRTKHTVFNRSASPAALRSGFLLNNADKRYENFNASDPSSRDVLLYLDGFRADPKNGEGYIHRGYQIVAMRAYGSQIDMLAGAMHSGTLTTGGLKISEILVYDYALNDEEFMDAQAYLARKWFGRTLAGYQSNETKIPQVQNLEVTGDAAVDVAENGVVKVGKIKIGPAGRLTKRGKGALVYDTLETDGASAGNVIVEDGVFGKDLTQDGVADMQPAAGATLHLDASDPTRIDTMEHNGKKLVSCWHDRKLRNVAYRSEDLNTAAFLDETDGCNGKPVVDFGPMGTVTDGAKYLSVGESMNSVRSVFSVWDGSRGGFFLGSRNNSRYGYENNFYDFHRGVHNDGFDSQSPLFLDLATMWMVSRGEIKIDGEEATYNTVPGAGFHLVEVHTTAGAHVSELGSDRGMGNRYGGQRIAELIIYERVLSEREKAATRNYLMKKWFNKDPDPLPSETLPAKDPEEYARLAVDGARELNVDADGGVTLHEIAGSGELLKTGAGALAVDEFSSFTGKITVAEGVLKLSSERFAQEGALVENGLLFHADASSGIVSGDDAGRTIVREWKSRHDEAWSAKPGHVPNGQTVAGNRAMDCPTFLPFGVKGLHPAVDLAQSNNPESEGCQFMRFAHNGDFTEIEGIRSVFWVLGSRRGGGYLLGGGHLGGGSAAHYNFHRGGANEVAKPEDPLLHMSENVVPKSSIKASWRKNGKEMNPTAEGLSGEWDQLSMIVKPGDAGVSAEGFAFDGRTIDYGGYRHRAGSQTIGEILIYNRSLSDEERDATEAYLRKKWNIGAYRDCTHAPEVDLAAEASLDLCGTTQYLASVSGHGTVRNGTLEPGVLSPGGDAIGTLSLESCGLLLPDGATWKIDVSPDKTVDFVSGAGRIDFAGALTLQIRGAGAITKFPYTVPVANAAEIGELPQIVWEFESWDAPKNMEVKFLRSGDELMMKIAPVLGTIVIIR